MRTVTDKAAGGGLLAHGEIAFLNALYAELGGRILQVPKYINGESADVEKRDYSRGFSIPHQESLLKTFGNGLLALSNEENADGGWTALTPGTRTALEAAMVDRPRTVTRSVGRFGSEARLTGGGSYRTLSTLLAHSAARGGVEFSTLLQAAAVAYATDADTLRHRLARPSPWAVVTSPDDPLRRSDGDDQAVVDRYLGKTKPSIVLGVGARNHRASLRNLTKADSRSFVRDLVRPVWDDKGRASAAVVSWLGRASLWGDSAAGLTSRQAQEGYYRLVQNLSTASDQTGEGDLYATATLGMERNPVLSHGLAIATKGNLRLFSLTHAARYRGDGTNWSALPHSENSWNDERGGTVSVQVATRMLRLSQYTASGRAEINVARVAYKRDLIHAARTGRSLLGESAAPTFGEAGRRAAYLDAFSIAGAENEIWREIGHKGERLTISLFEEYQQRSRATTAVKKLADQTAGKVPCGGFLLPAIVTIAASGLVSAYQPGLARPYLRIDKFVRGAMEIPAASEKTAAYDIAVYADTAGENVTPNAYRIGNGYEQLARVVDRSEVEDPRSEDQVVSWARRGLYEDYYLTYTNNATPTYLRLFDKHAAHAIHCEAQTPLC